MTSMSAPGAERVNLGDPFKLFPDGAIEVPIPPNMDDPRRSSEVHVVPEYYGTSKILVAPPLPDLMFRAVLGHSSHIHTSRDRLRLWIEADQNFLTQSGLVVPAGLLRVLDRTRLAGIEQLGVDLLKLRHGEYLGVANQTILRREIKFDSFKEMGGNPQTDIYLTANPNDRKELDLFAARFISQEELQSLKSQEGRSRKK